MSGRPLWHQWYGSQRWREWARWQLTQFPLCAHCEAKGKVVAATVADHIEPHRGNHYAFWFGKLQSLCASCHNATKQQVEIRGFSTEIGADGLPTDRRHPFYAGKVPKPRAFRLR